MPHAESTEPGAEPRGLGARLLREPLLHFIAVSALVFAAHHRFAETGRAQSSDLDTSLRITVDERFVDGLAQEAHRVSGREVDREAVLERWIHDEILMREAVRLGLDTHDAVVRQRLVQLAQLWLEANVQVPEPTEEQLQFVLERDAERYRVPARIGFTHVFFSSSRPQALDDAQAARSRLMSGEAVAGDAFLLGREIAPRTAQEIAGSFGTEFAVAVARIEPGIWSAPIHSSYGAHLVRVTSSTGPQLPALAEVRARVRADYLTERRETEVRRAVHRLRTRYLVERR